MRLCRFKEKYAGRSPERIWCLNSVRLVYRRSALAMPQGVPIHLFFVRLSLDVTYAFNEMTLIDKHLCIFCRLITVTWTAFVRVSCASSLVSYAMVNRKKLGWFGAPVGNHCTMGQNQVILRYQKLTLPRVRKWTKWANQWAQRRARAKRAVRSSPEQSGASKRVSGASERANGRASGPVLTSLFLFVPDHSAIGSSVSPWRDFLSDANLFCDSLWRNSP